MRLKFLMCVYIHTHSCGPHMCLTCRHTGRCGPVFPRDAPHASLPTPPHRHALVHSYIHSCSWPGGHTSCAYGHTCAQPPACTPVYLYMSARPCSSALSQRTPARHLQTDAVPRRSQPEEVQTEGSLIGQTWQLSLFHYSLAA